MLGKLSDFSKAGKLRAKAKLTCINTMGNTVSIPASICKGRFLYMKARLSLLFLNAVLTLAIW